jgi:hypothetical protein
MDKLARFLNRKGLLTEQTINQYGRDILNKRFTDPLVKTIYDGLEGAYIYNRNSLFIDLFEKCEFIASDEL